jgi:pilus assembly protein Flp/PilA
MSFIKAFLKDESGATMIEYGLVAALVSVAAIIALQLLGAELQVIFNTVSSYLASAVFAWSRINAPLRRATWNDASITSAGGEADVIRPPHAARRTKIRSLVNIVLIFDRSNKNTLGHVSRKIIDLDR